MTLTSLFFNFKRKMFLCKITEKCQDYCGHNFSNSRIEMKSFYHQFQHRKIQQDIRGHHRAIAEQLYPAFQLALGKNEILIEGKTNNKCDKRLNDQRGHRRSNHSRWKREGHMLLFQDEIIDHIIDHNACRGSCAPGDNIAESMYGEPSGKRRIKRINKTNNGFTHINWATLKKGNLGNANHLPKIRTYLFDRTGN